jgi:hypothetical protein
MSAMALTPEDEKRRHGRNRAIALALAAFVILIFVGSVVKMTDGVIPQMDVEIGR